MSVYWTGGNIHLQKTNSVWADRQDKAKMRSFGIIIGLFWLGFVNAATGEYTEGSVYMKSGVATFVADHMDNNSAAFGYYNNTLMTTGWGVFEVRSGGNGKMSNNDMMYAAGYLEGVFTAKQMWQHYQNVRPFFLPNGSQSLDPKFRSFLQQQETWTKNMIAKYQDSDPFWRAMGYIQSQLDGLYDGYKSVADESWEQSRYIVQFLNAVGDLIDIRNVVSPRSRPDYSRMTPAELLDYVHHTGHCSALIKVTGAYENLFMSHSSWFVYAATMRIYKHYHFNLQDSMVSAKSLSFSSYPGFLESLDDFYQLSSGMVILQTTNNVFNHTLYDIVTPQSLLSWQRMRVANLMADSGKEWYETFKKYNSGTYNNQYMVIDLKKVELRKTIHDDTLWVVEQIPGLVHGADQTPILRTGYWPSYNVPFYEDVYNISGYPEMVAQAGVDMSYQLAPRAKIFRRDQATVKDIDSMKNIMRYNDYKVDPYSEDNACYTICCRGDLNWAKPQPDGCYDTKVADLNMAFAFESFVINGPTLGENLAPFSWTGPFASDIHEGLPNVYNFKWQTMKPKL